MDSLLKKTASAFAVLAFILSARWARLLLACFVAIFVVAASILTHGFRHPYVPITGTSFIMSGQRVHIEALSVDRLKIDLLWRWLIGKVRVVSAGAAPIAVQISGIAIILRFEADDKLEFQSRENADERGVVEALAAIDSVMRSMHHRFAVLRPATSLLSLLGVTFQDISMKVYVGSYEVPAPVLQVTIGALHLHASRSDPSGDTVAFELELFSAANYSNPTQMLHWQGSEYFDFSVGFAGGGSLLPSLTLRVEVPYPANFLTAERPLFLPSVVALHVPPLSLLVARTTSTSPSWASNSTSPVPSTPSSNLLAPGRLPQLTELRNMFSCTRVDVCFDRIALEVKGTDPTVGVCDVGLVAETFQLTIDAAETIDIASSLQHPQHIAPGDGASSTELRLSFSRVNFSVDGNEMFMLTSFVTATSFSECTGSNTVAADCRIQVGNMTAHLSQPVFLGVEAFSKLVASSAPPPLTRPVPTEPCLAGVAVGVLAISVTMDLPEVVVVAQMAGLLAAMQEARSHQELGEKSRDAKLTLRLDGLRASGKGSGTFSDSTAEGSSNIAPWFAGDSFDGAVAMLSIEQESQPQHRLLQARGKTNEPGGCGVTRDQSSSPRETASARQKTERCVLRVVGVELTGTDVGGESGKDLRPRVDISSFEARWSPMLTRCVGTLAGSAARHLHHLLFTDEDPSQLLVQGSGSTPPHVLARSEAPLSEQQVEDLLNLDNGGGGGLGASNGRSDHLLHLLSQSLVVVHCKTVVVDFPFDLWSSVADQFADKSSTFTEAPRAHRRASMERGADENDDGTSGMEPTWEHATVRVAGATLAVQASCDGASGTSPADPSILLHLRNTELLGSGLSDLRNTELLGSGLSERPGVSATCGDDTQQQLEAQEKKSDIRELEEQSLFASEESCGQGGETCVLTVDAFALESFSERIVELCVAGVGAKWSPAAQLRILKAARDVTFSVWDALLCYRALKHRDAAPGLVLNPLLSDVCALQRCEERFAHGSLLGAGGDKLLRLYASKVALKASFFGGGDLVEVEVDRLQSHDLPERWALEGIRVALAGHPTVEVRSVSLRRTLDRDPAFVAGVALQELRARRHAVASAAKAGGDCVTPSLSELPSLTQRPETRAAGFGREGFLVHVSGASVRVGSTFDIADADTESTKQRVEQMMVHVSALVTALVSLPGRWVPGCPAFKRLFRSSTTYEHLLFGDVVGPQPAPEAWVVVEQVDMALGDDPLEAWLEQAYPLWVEDMAMRGVREEELARQIAAVKLTNSAEGSIRLVEMLEADSLAVSSEVFVARARKNTLSLAYFQGLDHPTGHREKRRENGRRGDKLRVSCAACECHLVGVKAEEDPLDEVGSGGKAKGLALLELLDACPPPRDACFDAFALASFQVSASRLSVTVRSFARPIFAAEAVKLEGSALMTRTTVPSEYHRVTHVSVDSAIAPQVVSQSYQLPRIHLDLKGHVTKPAASYSPAYEYGLEEIASGCGALYPSSMALDPAELRQGLRWWDLGRRLLTTRLDVSTDGMELSLLPSLRSFRPTTSAAVAATLSPAALKALRHSRKGFAHAVEALLEDDESAGCERLRMVCDRIRLRYQRMQVICEVQGMTCECKPIFGDSSTARPLATLPAVEISFGYEWRCRGDPANYHVYPVLCEGGRVKDMRPLGCASTRESTHKTSQARGEETGDLFHAFRSSGLSLHLSAKLGQPVGQLSPAAGIPLHFDGECSPLFTAPSSSASAPLPVLRPMPPHLVVCLYGTALGWLANWAAAFKRIPPVPYPAKCRPALDSGIWGLKAAIRSITVEAISIEGSSEYLVLDEPETPTNQASRGLRVVVHGATASMCVTDVGHAGHPNPFTSGCLATDPEDPTGRLWIVHCVRANVGHTEGRIVTISAATDAAEGPGSGGGGRDVRRHGCGGGGGGSSSPSSSDLFLFSVQAFTFQQRVRSCEGVTLQQSLEAHLGQQQQQKRAPPHASTDISSFAPLPNSPNSPSSSSSSSSSSPSYGNADTYLFGASIDDLRVVVTVEGRNALLEFGEFMYLTVTESLPDLDKPRADMLEMDSMDGLASPLSPQTPRVSSRRISRAPSSNLSRAMGVNSDFSSTGSATTEIHAPSNDTTGGGRLGGEHDGSGGEGNTRTTTPLDTRCNGQEYGDDEHSQEAEPGVDKEQPDSASTPARKPRSSQDTMGGLFFLQLNGAQIQILDFLQDNGAGLKPSATLSPAALKALRQGSESACVICALGAVVVQGWIGTVQGSPSSSSSSSSSSSPSLGRDTVDAPPSVSPGGGGGAAGGGATTGSHFSPTLSQSSLNLPSQSSLSPRSEGEILQRLVRRELENFVEAVNVQVQDMSVFCAPCDLDDTLSSGTHRWLPTGWLQTLTASSTNESAAAATLTPESKTHTSGHDAATARLAYDVGVYRCLLAPAKVLEANVVAEHAAVPIHSLRVTIPLLRIDCDSESFRRLLAVVSSVAVPPPPSHARGRVRRDQDLTEANLESRTAAALLLNLPQGPQQQNSSRVDSGDACFGGVGDSGEGVGASVVDAWKCKQAAQWELHRIVSLLGSLQLLERGVYVDEELDIGHLSTASNLRAWIDTCKRHLLIASAKRTATVAFLASLVGRTKASLQVQPHMHCTWLVGGVEVNLFSPAQRPLACFRLERIAGIFTNFLDWSGSLEVDVSSFEAHFLGTGSEEEEAGHAVLVPLDEVEMRRIRSSSLRKGGMVRLHPWDGIEPMVRLQARLGTPSPQGVTPVRHFETCVAPLVLTLTRRTVSTLAEFFRSPDEGAIRKHDDASREAFLPHHQHHPASKQPSHKLPFSLNLLSMGSSRRKSDDPPEPVSAAPVNSSLLPTTPHLPKHIPTSNNRDSRALLFGSDTHSAPGAPTASSGPEDSDVDGGSKSFTKDPTGSETGTIINPATSINFQYLRLGQIVLFVSYRGENWLELENFDSLQVKIHPFVMREQTCTLAQLGIGVRNHVVVDILSQFNRNFINIGAFLASKFSNLACCGHADWSAGATQPAVDEHGNLVIVDTRSPWEDPDEEIDDNRLTGGFAGAIASGGAHDLHEGGNGRALLFGKKGECGTSKSSSVLKKINPFKRS